MTILLLGSTGQLGRALAPKLRHRDRLVTAARSTEQGGVPKPDRPLDLEDTEGLPALFDAVEPALVVNAAAYTAVDRAESEPDRAMRVNGEAVGALARLCAARAIPFVSYGTDYVFDGRGVRPYVESDDTAPVSVYGRSKLLGEQGFRAAAGPGLMLRTSWVYAATGGNFLLTMLRLGQTQPKLRVVADQIGVPNWSERLAELTVRALDRHMIGELPWPEAGLYHLSALEAVSWHGFAEAIFEAVRRLAPPAIADRFVVEQVEAITTADYPTPAARPANSVLDSTRFHDHYHIEAQSWRVDLDNCVREWISRQEGAA
jgi:dTDP-4-dehydrorhamnose reductase